MEILSNLAAAATTTAAAAATDYRSDNDRSSSSTLAHCSSASRPRPSCLLRSSTRLRAASTFLIVFLAICRSCRSQIAVPVVHRSPYSSRLKLIESSKTKMSANQQVVSSSSPSTSRTRNGETSKCQNPSEVDRVDGDNACGVTLAAEADKKCPEYVRVRVITSDMTNEIHFRLKHELPMHRMKRAYASKLGFNADELRFMFDGIRITDYDTPKKLGLVDDDVIEIYQERTGGGM